MTQTVVSVLASCLAGVRCACGRLLGRANQARAEPRLSSLLSTCPPGRPLFAAGSSRSFFAQARRVIVAWRDWVFRAMVVVVSVEV